MSNSPLDAQCSRSAHTPLDNRLFPLSRFGISCHMLVEVQMRLGKLHAIFCGSVTNVVHPTFPLIGQQRRRKVRAVVKIHILHLESGFCQNADNIGNVSFDSMRAIESHRGRCTQSHIKPPTEISP